MKKTYFLVLFSFVSSMLLAQKATLMGTISDDTETLIGASVQIGSTGAITDENGQYKLLLDPGTYEVTYSYLGYSDITEKVTLAPGEVKALDIKLSEGQALTEVTVTADIAIERKTPVAFSNIDPKKLTEELGGRDLPMVLNSTPGAYATQSGGGDGDARITIRGFNQRNVAVMLDGIPVNDMENGQVYWSNWFGLDLVTKAMQVQRGLGASKLAIPSIGGTINILTKGIDDKRSVRLSQEYNSFGFTRTTFGINSGRMKGGWGVSAAASFKRQDGYAQETWSKGFFWYLRLDKQIKNHTISLQGFGAPQMHGQRTGQRNIETFSGDVATREGVTFNSTDSPERGLDYNAAWGNLARYRYENGDTVFAESKPYNTAVNYYHKPQFSLRHSWQISRRTFWSNVAYLSMGNGGGTGQQGTLSNLGPNGTLDIQTVYNSQVFPNIFNPTLAARNIIRSSVNNHFWYGALSTIKHQFNEDFTVSGGLDYRFYRGEHYREVRDLLGGRYFLPTGDARRNARIDETKANLQVGDKYFYNYNGYVQWGGAFALAEYTKDKLSVFLNVSGGLTRYKYTDFMMDQQAQVGDTTIYMSYLRPQVYNGTLYTVNDPSVSSVQNAIAAGYAVDSTSAQNQSKGWINLPNFTTKLGASYRLDDNNTVFVNLGYFTKATRFNNVFKTQYSVVNVPGGTESSGRLLTFDAIPQEVIMASEIGYNYKSPKLSANLNTYYTVWNNKPADSAPTAIDPRTQESVAVNMTGLNARHMGIELDFIYKILSNLHVEGLASVGDWKWTSIGTYTFPDGQTGAFDARGLHVGDAAQLQLGGSLRYEPTKHAYIKIQTMYFGKNYANFSPDGSGAYEPGRDVWKMPDYILFNAYAGYDFKYKGINASLKLGALNIMNAKYITDAQNNVEGSGNDATSATVFFGAPRAFNSSLTISF